MADDIRRVVREDETIVAGAPATTVQAPGAAPVVMTTPPVGDRVVAHTSQATVIDPPAERAASVDWLSRLIWMLVGLLDILLVMRFVLLMAGANASAGFAQLIYGVTNPFLAPFAGLFGRPLTYDGAVQNGYVEFEALVAVVVYSLIGWGLVKLAQLALGTNRTRGTVVEQIDRQTRI